MNQTLDIVSQLDQADDDLKRRRLRTMQRVALGLLLAALALFAVARSLHGQHPAWGYVEAFAEAAMVGAIADWFAVVALFRHPLGVPLWHTAIIPNSKDEIAGKLGTFVETHFVTEESVARQIRKSDVALLAGEWLLHPLHAAQLSRTLTTLLKRLLPMIDDARMRGWVAAQAGAELGKLDLSGIAGECIDALVADGKPQDVLDGVFDKFGAWLAEENNHPAIETFLMGLLAIDNPMVKTMLGAYLPKIIGSVNTQVAAIRLDRAHPLRARVGEWIADGALRLKADPGWRDAVAQYQGRVLASDKVSELLNGLWDGFRNRLLTDLDSETPAFTAAAQGLIEKAGRLLVTEAAARGWLNDAVEAAGVALVRRYQGEVGSFIEQQLAQWSKEEVADRVELAIGRDLQFIRINGTIVGGLAGLIIYAVTMAM